MYNFHIGDAVYWKGIEMKIVDFVDGIIRAHNANATLRVTDVPETFSPIPATEPTTPTEVVAPIEAIASAETLVSSTETEVKSVLTDVETEVKAIAQDIKKV